MSSPVGSPRCNLGSVNQREVFAQLSNDILLPNSLAISPQPRAHEFRPTSMFLSSTPRRERALIMGINHLQERRLTVLQGPQGIGQNAPSLMLLFFALLIQRWIFQVAHISLRYRQSVVTIEDTIFQPSLLHDYMKSCNKVMTPLM